MFHLDVRDMMYVEVYTDTYVVTDGFNRYVARSVAVEDCKETKNNSQNNNNGTQTRVTYNNVKRDKSTWH